MGLNLCYSTIGILGMGISNEALIRYLHKIGATDIYVFDKNDSPEAVDKLETLQDQGYIADFKAGDGYITAFETMEFDIVFKAPVIRSDIPSLVKASLAGTIISSEIQLFLELCPGKVFAVTGSDGKSTTTTIIYRLLEKIAPRYGGKAWLGGNIGFPLIEYVDEMTEKDFVALELSSFQLMNMPIGPCVSVITNITPNHLDIHKDYDEYIQAKMNIFAHSGPESSIVLNYGCPVTRQIGQALGRLGAEVRYFTGKISSSGLFALRNEDGEMYFSQKPELSFATDSILLPGQHNWENYMAAISAVADYVRPEDIHDVAGSFGGVEHRLEFVRELKGVRYYNSSIDSSPNRTINALSVFSDKKVILIAGGKDKKIPYDELGPHICRAVKVLILTGPTGKVIEKSVREAEKKMTGQYEEVKIFHASDYGMAVKIAYEYGENGDVVLLSPASTSFDAFRNFEERGKTFKAYVDKLS